MPIGHALDKFQKPLELPGELRDRVVAYPFDSWSPAPHRYDTLDGAASARRRRTVVTAAPLMVIGTTAAAVAVAPSEINSATTAMNSTKSKT
ncbi:hypothetical protein C5E46_35105 [Nocardia nova]|nr:hypothetical protein C5E46_35105 [Nocardia nova]